MAGTKDYLKPRVGNPAMLRSERNGQFVNPPLYMEWGGAKSASMLNRETGKNLSIEKNGPKAQGRKPL